MIELQDYEIRCIEEEILNVFNASPGSSGGDSARDHRI